MFSYDAVTASYFASRGPMVAHLLIWVQAKTRDTGALAEIGFWTGDDHMEFTLGGVVRTYYGASAALEFDPLSLRTGLTVRSYRVRLSQIPDEVQLAFRGYEPRHAPVEIHRALFDAETGLLVAEPHLRLRGYIDRATIKTPAEGGTGSVEVAIASAARALSKPLARKRSHESLVARAPTDQFRKYASIADAVETPWGKASTRATSTPHFPVVDLARGDR